MKYRNGFVSNSSSSSFIINAENELSTVKDVAKYIIDTCINTFNINNWPGNFFIKEVNTPNCLIYNPL